MGEILVARVCRAIEGQFHSPELFVYPGSRLSRLCCVAKCYLLVDQLLNTYLWMPGVSARVSPSAATPACTATRTGAVHNVYTLSLSLSLSLSHTHTHLYACMHVYICVYVCTHTCAYSRLRTSRHHTSRTRPPRRPPPPSCRQRFSKC